MIIFQPYYPGLIKAIPAVPEYHFASLDHVINHPHVRFYGTLHPNCSVSYHWRSTEGSWAKSFLIVKVEDSQGKSEYYHVGLLSEKPVSIPRWEHPDAGNKK